MVYERHTYAIRSPFEVAWRALAITTVIGLANGRPRTDIDRWVNALGLRRALSPLEIAFLDAEPPSEQQVTDNLWQWERLIMVMWALGKIDQVPPPDTAIGQATMITMIPPYADGIGAADFIQSAQLRSETELLEMAEVTRHHHWRARDARLAGRTLDPRIDLEIIQERHHGINWVIGYYADDWDDVRTDT